MLGVALGHPPPIRLLETDIRITITQLIEIDEKKHSFHIEFMLLLKWKARRDGDQWQPRMQWANAREIHPIEADPAFVPAMGCAKAGQMIQRVQHFRGVFVHPFKIKKFPVDHQKFQVVLVSNTAKEVKFVPIPTKDNFARKFLLAGSIKQFKPNQYVKKKAVRNKHLEFPCGTWKIHEINQPDMLDNKDELKIDQKSKVS